MPPTTRKKQSGNPQNRQDKYAPSAWGSQSMYQDLTFPSGQTALVRRPGLEGLMKAGIVHNLDTLTPIIEKHKGKAQGKRSVEVDVAQLIRENPNALSDMIHVVDRILCHCVVKPEIEMTPNDPTSRVNGTVYADMVDLEDKFFLFNFVVGGTRDLERFREQSQAALGGVRAEQEDEAAPE